MELSTNQSGLEEENIKILKLLQEDSKRHERLILQLSAVKKDFHGFFSRWAPEFIDYKSVKEAYKSVEKTYGCEDYAIKLYVEEYTYTQSFNELLLRILEAPHELGVWLNPIKFAFLAMYYNRCWIMRTISHSFSKKQDPTEMKLKVTENLDYIQHHIIRLCVSSDPVFSLCKDIQAMVIDLRKRNFSRNVFQAAKCINSHLDILFSMLQNHLKKSQCSPGCHIPM